MRSAAIFAVAAALMFGTTPAALASSNEDAVSATTVEGAEPQQDRDVIALVEENLVIAMSDSPLAVASDEEPALPAPLLNDLIDLASAGDTPILYEETTGYYAMIEPDDR
jgi:hypothetical protein